MKSVAKPEGSSLAMFLELLSAGFRSRHEATVNDLIVVWNQIFGKAEALEYPEALHHALSRICSKVQIDLPGFVDDEETDVVGSHTISKLSSMINRADSRLDHVFPFQLCRVPGRGYGSRSRTDLAHRCAVRK